MKIYIKEKKELNNSNNSNKLLLSKKRSIDTGFVGNIEKSNKSNELINLKSNIKNNKFNKMILKFLFMKFILKI